MDANIAAGFSLHSIKYESVSLNRGCVRCCFLAILCLGSSLCPADRSFVLPYIRNHHLILHLKITRGNKCSASCFTYLLGIKMYLGWEGSLTCFGWMIHASEQPVLGEAGWNSLWMHLQRHSLLNLFALWKLRFLLRIKSYGFNFFFLAILCITFYLP